MPILSNVNSNDELIRTITERVITHIKGSKAKPLDQECNATAAECTGHGFCGKRKNQTMKNMIQMGATRFGAGPGIRKPSPEIARRIDHTLLKPDATREELDRLCEEAIQYGFATVCVNSFNIPYVARRLKRSEVKPIAVVGFPLGASSSKAKAFESVEAVRNGAKEIDMVINVGALKSKDYRTVEDDICEVVRASAPQKVKVILETALLDLEEKIAGCVLAKAAGAHFVKTSTGFGPGGATTEDVELMRRVVGQDMKVKASGGIRTKEDALAMLKAGADRIGASASVAIVKGRKGSGGY